PLPWTQPGTYTGNAIDFGGVPVGQTKTATYTFKILETSATSATVTITRPNPPFGSDAPTYPFTLAPGQSITFNVTFTPPAVGHYTGSFTITAQGGRPVQVKTQTVILTGQGVAGIEYRPPSEKAPGGPAIAYPEEVVTPTLGETAQLEAKLDVVGRTLDELRQKLDNLGWWLGKLTAGFPLGIEPHSTNPIPETNIWELLAKLEAKLDRLVQRPTETTTPDINITIIEIYNIIIEINQLIINLGGNVAGLETKLDRMAQRPSEATVPDINITIIEIYNIIVEINQFIFNLGGNVAGLETKLDQLSTDLFDLWLDLMSLWDDLDDMWDEMNDRFDDVEDAVAANTRAIRALQDSNNRIEDKLNQLLGTSGLPAPPSAPDAAKITLTMGGGPLPHVPWEATVEGNSGVVQPNALVTIYWPLALPPSTVTADGTGAFVLNVTTGNISYHSVEVTQTVGGHESARVSVPAS
ncbi:hypothetical protein KAW44_02560, partial [Candidatus Bipolaricaulota bacterium]|nr:hypothetical protein [Candidatus Bipolaricaulota bacterium]